MNTTNTKEQLLDIFSPEEEIWVETPYDKWLNENAKDQIERTALMVLENMRLIFGDDANQPMPIEFYSASMNPKSKTFGIDLIPVPIALKRGFVEVLRCYILNNMPDTFLTACICIKIENDGLVPEDFIDENKMFFKASRALVVHIETMHGSQIIYSSDIIDGKTVWPPDVSRIDKKGSVMGEGFFPDIIDMGFEA